MKIGEVCLLTNDVPRLAAFYKQLLGIENNSGMRYISSLSPKRPR